MVQKIQLFYGDLAFNNAIPVPRTGFYTGCLVDMWTHRKLIFEASKLKYLQSQ